MCDDYDENVFGEALNELRGILDELHEFGIKVDTPSIGPLSELQKLNDRYCGALLVAENTEDELVERNLFIGYDEFRLVGTLPKRGMVALKQAVFDKSLADSWNFDEQILAMLAEHMPSVRVKQIKN